MADSLQNIDKRCVFRESFESEQSVRRNGSIFTGTISNSALNVGYLKFPFQHGAGTYSIRIILNPVLQVGNQYIFSRAEGVVFEWISQLFSTYSIIDAITGSFYVDGVLSFTMHEGRNEVVISGCNLAGKNYYLGARGSDGGEYFKGSFSLIEIYQGTLTADEVKNLYENKRYREVNARTGLKPILDVSAESGTIRNKLSGNTYNELVSNGTFITDVSGWESSYDAGGVVSWENSRLKYINSSGSSYITQTISSAVSGKTYIVEWDGEYSIDTGTNTANVFIGAPALNSATRIGNHYRAIVIANGTRLAIRNMGSGTPFTQYFDNISVKELIPSVIPTAVEVVKENDVYAMRFNGSTSKIDCGSYDTLIGDKTFVTWVNNKYPLSGIRNRILSNSKAILSIREDLKRVEFISDGATAINSGSGSTSLNKPLMIVVTRTSIGLTTFYLNGVVTGTSNQSSGTPAAGITNITIGTFGSDWYRGLVPSVRIYDGLMTPAEIAQLYSNEKQKYGL